MINGRPRAQCAKGNHPGSISQDTHLMLTMEMRDARCTEGHAEHYLHKSGVGVHGGCRWDGM